MAVAVVSSQPQQQMMSQFVSPMPAPPSPMFTALMPSMPMVQSPFVDPIMPASPLLQVHDHTHVFVHGKNVHDFADELQGRVREPPVFPSSSGYMQQERVQEHQARDSPAYPSSSGHREPHKERFNTDHVQIVELTASNMQLKHELASVHRIFEEWKLNHEAAERRAADSDRTRLEEVKRSQREKFDALITESVSGAITQLENDAATTHIAISELEGLLGPVKLQFESFATSAKAEAVKSDPSGFPRIAVEFMRRVSVAHRNALSKLQDRRVVGSEAAVTARLSAERVAMEAKLREELKREHDKTLDAEAQATRLAQEELLEKERLRKAEADRLVAVANAERLERERAALATQLATDQDAKRVTAADEERRRVAEALEKTRQLAAAAAVAVHPIGRIPDHGALAPLKSSLVIQVPSHGALAPLKTARKELKRSPSSASTDASDEESFDDEPETDSEASSTSSKSSVLGRLRGMFSFSRSGSKAGSKTPPSKPKRKRADEDEDDEDDTGQ